MVGARLLQGSHEGVADLFKLPGSTGRRGEHPWHGVVMGIAHATADDETLGETNGNVAGA